MLLIQTKLGLSNIEGIGLFADQFVKKGTLIWQFTEGVDIIISEKIISTLSTIEQNFIKKYAYNDKKTNFLILCTDNARFMNHSFYPNCYSIYTNDIEYTYANISINPGKELTINYNDFELNSVDF